MPNGSELPLALDELSWIDVAAHVARDGRVIIPVGALEQHGPHLPLGSNVLIARSLAVDLSREFRILRAPTIYYGVNVRTERAFAGTASLNQKTLHRALNELLDSWETHGMCEFILITAHRHEPHLEALATLVTHDARVRVIQAWDVDISHIVSDQLASLHAGEAETSVMLHLYPELVRMDRARDHDLPPEQYKKYINGRLPVPLVGGAGVIGHPTAATAEKGARIYQCFLDAIRRAVFLLPSKPETDTL
jgi:creatinine amidohydrolase